MTQNLHNFINSIKQGYLHKKSYVDVPYFFLGKKILLYLSKYGYISGFETLDKDLLKFDNLSIYKLKIYNFNQLKNLYAHLYSLDFVLKLSDDKFIQLLKLNRILNDYNINRLKTLNVINLHILSFKQNNLTNNTIYWNKKELDKDLKQFKNNILKYFRIYLKYFEDEPSIKDIIIMSSSKKLYHWNIQNIAKVSRLKRLRIRNKLSMRAKYNVSRVDYILSTSKGLLSLNEAFIQKLGGIPLLKILS